MRVEGSMPRILIASTNAGKLREIRSLFSNIPVKLIGLDQLPPDSAFVEEGETFAEVAGAKALHYHLLHKLPAVADDSGLVVDALDGEPGVRSSRYLGEDTPFAEKMSSILARLEGIPPEKRTARFTCAVAVAIHGRVVSTIVKHVFGRIIDELRGSGGFGYDPIFYCPKLKVTFAEAAAEDKNRVSHRGQAFRALSYLFETHDPIRTSLGL